jgi:hypothetical protein
MPELSSGLTSADTVSLLATTGGIALVVFLVMQAVRKPLEGPTWDRFAPTIALALGIVLAELFAFATVSPFSGVAALGALVSGVIGGALSQNANTAWRRIVDPPGS